MICNSQDRSNMMHCGSARVGISHQDVPVQQTKYSNFICYESGHIFKNLFIDIVGAGASHPVKKYSRINVYSPVLKSINFQLHAIFQMNALLLDQTGPFHV